MGKKQTTISTNSLPAYTGEWTAVEAAHLLRRTLFGPKKSEILQATAAGLEATVSFLLATDPEPAPPVNQGFDQDPLVPIGETWVDAPGLNSDDTVQYRRQSLMSWIFQLALADTTVREKMVLFWQNHFGLTFNGNPLVRYRWNALLRRHATGDFRQLVKDVTIEPAMLVFLNGNQNNANNPNENYGRELLELYTIGKGPQIAEGDYSNYTEDDVRALTRALTGWRTRNLNPTDPDEMPESFFQPNRHDETDKQLSYHFDNQVITNGGAEEYAEVVDILLAELETARYIVREFYRFFVYYDITETEEAEVIEPLAQFFYDSDYDVAATLGNLFRSQHFYDVLNRGPLIKDPLSFGLGAIRPFGYEHVDDATLLSHYNFHLQLYRRTNNLGMDYLSPPTVSGWEAWYQAPVFHRSWINSSTLQQRKRHTDRLTQNGYFASGVNYNFDLIGWIAQLDNPFDPNTLIEEATRILLPQPLVQSQLDSLKELLIPGLPDFEWTDEYGLYLADPDNNALRMSVENKLKTLFRGIFDLAEFHLS